MHLLNNYYFYLKKNFFIIIFLIVNLLVIVPQTVYSQSTNSIPTITWNGAAIPSWGEITFSNMPTISENGSLNAPPKAISQIGYDFSRIWDAGQTPDQYMMLGDFQDSFELQNFTLSQIAYITSSDLQQINLNNFQPLKFQTIETLLQAIPSLKGMLLSEVTPIKDLIAQNISTHINSTISIGKILKQSPLLKNLQLKSLKLEQYKIDSIPGLSQIPIAKFKDWQITKIVGIPGLNQVPFNKFPNPINLIGSTVGLVDIAFETAEQEITRTVSGSDKQGYAVPCQKNCAHAELSGDSSIKGKGWISGKYNLVEGGHGILGSVNGGKEPTGRNPFGSAFKVVVWNSSEKDGMISQALFFRACMRSHFVDLGCTPYVIGPIPFLTYKEKQPIFIGLVETDTNTSNSPSTPTGEESNGFTFKSRKSNSPTQFTSQTNQNNKITNLLNIKKASCSNTGNIAGVNVEALNTALSNIQGNYDFIGNYLCNQKGNCGRPLGPMQFMSYSPEVRKIIANKPGGSNFLNKLDIGENVTGSEMLEFFSSDEQQKLASAKTNKLLNIASKKIDIYTGDYITGERLINHAAQMSFAGNAIPVDAEIINPPTEESTITYGQKVNNRYSQILKSMNCN